MTKWQMNRAGLLSFWYYDDEIFEFANGKLLLRGTNGSGKSVTMQSFIPVLLDGKKSPDRLDPFGSKARKMSDYLLGEEEISGRDERTGYLFLEYKMAGTEQYITTGIGMQARRHKDLKSWYFVITDNRRIGIDLELAHRSLNEIIPFSQKELTNRIGTGGMVTNSQKEYAALVNKYVFGFETMEAYEDLVKLLIQLRAPKLSKDFKPTVLYEILESALPPITDDELRHLSDTIESMDQTEQQLEQLTIEYEANKKIVKRYDAYNTYILVERAERVLKAEERLATIRNEKNTNLKEQEQIKQSIEQLQQEYRQIKTNLTVYKNEEQSLSRHEIWTITKKLHENKEQLTTLKNRLNQLSVKKDAKEMKRIQQLETQKQKEYTLESTKSKQKEITLNMQSLAEEADFAQHTLNINSLERQSADFKFWKREVKEHKEQLRQLEKQITALNHLQEKDKQLQIQSSNLLQEIDLLEKDIEQASHWYSEELQELKTAIFMWMKTYNQIAFTSEQEQQISLMLEQLYNQSSYHDVTNILITGINGLRAQFEVKLQVNKEKQKQLQHALIEQQQVLEKLQSEEFADPSRMPGTVAFRQQLTEQQIPYLPFYAAVEFQEHVTDEQKARIEAALASTGILDSLISPETFNVEEDSFLVANPRLLGHTLADFLQSDVEGQEISSALVDDILRSIPIDETESVFTIDEKGFYRLGIITGHAPKQGPSKFIGRTSRKRYQLEQMELVQQTMREIEDQLQTERQKYNEIEQQLRDTRSFEATIPSDKTVYDIDVEIRNRRETQKIKQQEQKKIDDQWQAVHLELKTLRQQLYTEKEKINLVQTTEAVNEAIQYMDDYLEELNDLERVLMEKSNVQSDLVHIKENLEEIELEIDEFHSDIIDIQTEQDQIIAEITSQEQQLELEGAEAIQQRIAKVQQELRELEKRDNDLRTDIPKQEAKQEKIQDVLRQLQQDEEFSILLVEQWKRALQEELDLGFIQLESKEPRDIVKQYNTQQDRVKLQEYLSRVQNEEMHALTEYNVNSYLKETALLPQLEDVVDDRLEAFKQLRGRRIVELDYRGQRVSPYRIDAVLAAELEESRHYLDAQDRELYEDIIVNSVGTILRQRISRAEQWVKQMDKIMAERDNSSGLIFSVSWKPRTAESEAELDTKELVQLLQRKSSFLSEEDLQKITKHFRSRIESAKESIGLRNEGNTLRQVLKEVLDYRKWFSFVLYYTRQHESKKELTNNAFYKFSGGEKAMAMYIPLFTAAYSRYKEADAMAPYIISLDEAFAGVDDQNIRDMFEVVEQLGFNYIMNSQAIWGDCDTVPSLAIAELVRPKNADYVTVLNYRWNGKERVLIE